jgi:hypothetical protein
MKINPERSKAEAYGYIRDSIALVNRSHVFGFKGVYMSKRTLASLLLPLISSSVFVPYSVAKDSLVVQRLVNPVGIDGKWTTPDEWSDTQRISMYVAEGPRSTGFLRVKYDDQYLYVLVDFVSDTTPAIEQTRGEPVHWCYDGVTVAIDKYASEEKPKDEADLVIQLRWLSGYDRPEAVTPTDAWIEGAMSYDAANDLDSQTSHAIYELAIPMQVFQDPSSIRVSVWDPSSGVTMHWPAYDGSWSTKYFGDLLLSQEQQIMTHQEDTRTPSMEPVTLLAIAAFAALVVLVLLYFRAGHS